MAVPGGPGGQVGTPFEPDPRMEPDPRNDPSPRVPKPLPDRGRRAGSAAFALLVAALIVVLLIVLL